MSQIEPVIILVEPQLGANIGAVARVMKNFCLTQLRLVNPRDGWPNPEAPPMSAGADDVLEHVQVFEDLAQASGDLHCLFGATARAHYMIKPFYGPREAVGALSTKIQEGLKVGIAFGAERCGLTSDHVSLCDGIITIPTDPEFPSLNLSQAAGLLCYEWGLLKAKPEEGNLRLGVTDFATKDHVNDLFSHLEEALEESGFLRHEKKRPNMIRNIRTMFGRIQFTEQEIQTFRGMIRSLVEKRRKS